MKRKYNTALLSAGIAIVLSQIAAFVLQDYFERSLLTLSFQLDIFMLMAVAFALILQFKSSEKVVSILLVVYGAFNLIHGVTANRAVGMVVNSLEIEVIFVLGLLIAHSLFEISALFILVHSTQTRFETSFTKKFVLISLSVSLGLLVLILPFVTRLELDSVLKAIFAVIAIAVLYFAMYLMVTDRPIVEEPEPVKPASKLEELEGLLRRGIISQAEYDARKNKLNQ